MVLLIHCCRVMISFSLSALTAILRLILFAISAFFLGSGKINISVLMQGYTILKYSYPAVVIRDSISPEE